jgi:hypothetical protein
MKLYDEQAIAIISSLLSKREWPEPAESDDDFAAKILEALHASGALNRPALICAQYIEQAKAKRTERGSFVDGAVQLQIETALEIADRIAGSRVDEERQITLYWAETLGKWVTIPEDAG